MRRHHKAISIPREYPVLADRIIDILSLIRRLPEPYRTILTIIYYSTSWISDALGKNDGIHE